MDEGEHQHENQYAELQRTTYRRVTHYFEICVCGAYRRVNNRVPEKGWRCAESGVE